MTLEESAGLSLESTEGMRAMVNIHEPTERTISCHSINQLYYPPGRNLSLQEQCRFPVSQTRHGRTFSIPDGAKQFAPPNRHFNPPGRNRTCISSFAGKCPIH